MKNVEKLINDLVGYDNLKIVQSNDYFNFSLDSVLLPNFVELKKNTQNIIDLGCGNAPIPLILSTKTNSKIIGIEIQKEIYDLAIETVELNKLESQIEIKNIDIKDIFDHYKRESFDLVLSNPPYFKLNEKSILNENEVKTNARHETLIKLDELISISSKLLKNKGALVLIHRTERIQEILEIMSKNKLEAKRIRFVFPKKNENSNLVLIDARKNANRGVKVLPPLLTHKANGDYTKEILKMFER